MKYNFDEIINRENTNSVKLEFRKEYFGDQNVIPMWVADMDFATPKFIRVAIIERAKHPVYGYTVRGKEFKNSIISWMKKRHNWDINEEWIVFSPGIVPAVNIATLAYSEKYENIILQPPVYHPFFSAVKDHERGLLENNLVYRDNKYFIDFEDFEAKCKESKLFIFCHPHNPVGRMWEKDELKKILEICTRNEVLILSDEIHSDLILADKKHIPLLQLEGSHDNTIAFFAASKTFNLAGLSTSFLIIPNDSLRRKFETKINHLHLGMGNIFGNIALETAYNEGEEWLEELLSYLRKNYAYLKSFIEKRIPQIKVVPTEATYLVWLDMSGLNLGEKDLREFIINNAGLGLNDGPSFGKAGIGFQRINIACPFEVLKSALQKIEDAVKNLK
jgi:cystathionine beta-lyase